MGSNGAPRGVKRGHSIPYHHQQGAPHPPTPRGTPFDPVFTVDIAIFEVKFDIAVSMITFSMLNSMLTSFVFDVKRLEIFDAKMVSMLHFSMFPYSILIASIY